jgi:axial budding pattern protein 2
MRLFLAAALAVLSFSITLARADITVSNPLRNQLPQIAHAGTSYTWTIATDTFAFTPVVGVNDAASDMSYSAIGLPSWAAFDATTLTFSGSPTSSDIGDYEVTVTASMAAVSAMTDVGTSASSRFTLITIQEPAPTLSLPIAQQLLNPQSNSLGPTSVLPPGNILYIPPGWSFSMGFDGNTFTLADGNEVFMSASVNGTTALPSWMTWSADTYTLYGVAPSAQTGVSTYNVVMTGSNMQGYGGVSDAFQIKVAAHILSLATPLRSVNASVGSTFTYSIPTTGLDLDQRQNNNASNPVKITVNLAETPWLMYDQETASISGAPPFDQYGNASTTQVVSLPIAFADTYGNNLPANLTINIAPYAFTVQTIPNLVVAAGKEVSLDLSQYIRNISTPQVLAVGDSTSSGQEVTAQFDPANATSWLSFNPSDNTLSGIMPSDPNTRVKVNLQMTNSNNDTSSASLYVETPAANSSNGDSPASGGNNLKHGSGSSGLSHRAKLALGISLGAIGGLLALILLMICCRRHVAKEDHDHRGYLTDERDDQTLTDTSSNRKFNKAIVISRPKGILTPTTIAASPYADHEKLVGPSADPAMLASVMVEDPSGEKRDITNDTADQPKQSRLIGNLFGGKKKQTAASSDRGHIEPSATLGLGLSTMDDPYSSMGAAMTNSRSQGGIGNFQSEQSMRTHRSSWESDLFYEDAGAGVAIHNSLAASDSADDVPRRRGQIGNELTVRHRNTHHNASPAFNAPGMFTPPDNTGSQGSLGRMEEENYSEAYGSAGQLSGRTHEEAQILEAKVMQVRRHSPMIQNSGNPFSQTRGRSAEAEEKSNSGAFDDAEWETETDGHSSDIPTRRNNQNNNRVSTMSAMTDSSQMQTMRGYYANEIVRPAPPLRQPDVFSPNPSFLDGASISGFEPSETMRAVAVPSRPRTPPFARHQQTASNASSRPRSAISTASRFMNCPSVPAIVNYPVRFHIYPTVPPPMAGAPGSPGKRSGDGVRYSLIVDDSRPHLAPFRMTWPDMLGDWLTFNDATFEAFGIVPNNAGLEDLGDVEIALIAIKRTAKVPPSPKASGNSSPTRRHHKRTSTLSFDSSHTVITEDDVTVVARAKLVFQSGPQVY